MVHISIWCRLCRLLAFRSLITMGATLLHRWNAYQDVLCSPWTLVLIVKAGKYLKLSDTSPPQSLKTIADLLTDTTRHDDIPLPIIDPYDIVVLFQTSGSTGTPKFVARTHTSCMLIRRVAAEQGLQYLSSNSAFNDRPFGWG